MAEVPWFLHAIVPRVPLELSRLQSPGPQRHSFILSSHSFMRAWLPLPVAHHPIAGLASASYSSISLSIKIDGGVLSGFERVCSGLC